MELQDDFFRLDLLDLNSSWSNESNDQFLSNSICSEQMVTASEDHIRAKASKCTVQGLINISEEELKIRSELENDIEKDLEGEIKDGICHLAHQLHRLYQHQRERIARELCKNGPSSARVALFTEIQIVISMEGGSTVEMKEIKKEKGRLKTPITKCNRGRKIKVGGEFDWARTLRSDAVPTNKKKFGNARKNFTKTKCNASSLNEGPKAKEEKFFHAS